MSRAKWIARTHSLLLSARRVPRRLKSRLAAIECLYAREPACKLSLVLPQLSYIRTLHLLDNFPIETIRPNYLWGFESPSLLAACSRLSDSRGWRVSERHVKIRRVMWERGRFGGGFSSHPVLFSCSSFLYFADPTVSKPWTGYISPYCKPD